jgi:hypothetical protein
MLLKDIGLRKDECSRNRSVGVAGYASVCNARKPLMFQKDLDTCVAEERMKVG